MIGTLAGSSACALTENMAEPSPPTPRSASSWAELRGRSRAVMSPMVEKVVHGVGFNEQNSGSETDLSDLSHRIG